MANYEFNSEFIGEFIEKAKIAKTRVRQMVSGNQRTVERWVQGGDMRTGNLVSFVNQMDIDILNFFRKDGELMIDIDRRKDEEIEMLQKEVQTAREELEKASGTANSAGNTERLLRDLMREQSEAADRKEEQARQRHMQELADKDRLILAIQMEKNDELLRAKEEILHLKEEIARLTAEYKELELAQGTYTGAIGVAEKNSKKYKHTTTQPNTHI